MELKSVGTGVEAVNKQLTVKKLPEHRQKHNWRLKTLLQIRYAKIEM